MSRWLLCLLCALFCLVAAPHARACDELFVSGASQACLVEAGGSQVAVSTMTCVSPVVAVAPVVVAPRVAVFPRVVRLPLRAVSVRVRCAAPLLPRRLM